MSDNVILAKLRAHDEGVTREYFYGFCRVAYGIFDRRYELRNKAGMDFYSLAHEYYITLDRHGWRQLEDRKPSMSLRTWMTNGFRFLILDRLKQSARERAHIDIDERAAGGVLRFENLPDDDYYKDVAKIVEEIANRYYGRDSKSSIILKMLLIDGYKGVEVSQQLGITPSAISQRYRQMMRDVVVPYFKTYYEMPGHDVLGDGHRRLREWYYSGPVSEDACLFESPSIKLSFMGGAKSSKYMNIKGKIAKKRCTPNCIEHLADDEIFVFGSNLHGMHGGGAARLALQRFGAKMGVGVGIQGHSYGIPTMQGGVETIAPYVDDFIAYAKAHPKQKFLVTRIGCGIAGFDPEDIAPLFAAAVDVDNICLPKDFWAYIL